MTVFTAQHPTLTKIVANAAQTGVRRDLRDVQRMHHVLTTLACPPDFGPASRSAAGLLYRVEHTSAGVHILVQSLARPDHDRLTSGYAIAGTVELTPLLDRLTVGADVRYRIVANATKSIPRGPDVRGRVRALKGAEAVDWWHRKAARTGLELTSTTAAAHTRLRGNRTKGGRHSPVTIDATTFEGTATITEPQAVHDAILTGIGRGRAYGCGLLSLAPLH